jgi:hypothetical protein
MYCIVSSVCDHMLNRSACDLKMSNKCRRGTCTFSSLRTNSFRMGSSNSSFTEILLAGISRAGNILTQPRVAFGWKQRKHVHARNFIPIFLTTQATHRHKQLRNTTTEPFR